MSVAATGCIDLRRGESNTAREVLSSEPRIVSNGSFGGSAKVEGSILKVKGDPRCRLVEMRRIEETTTYDQELNDDEALALVGLGVLGSLPLAGGIIMLADAPAVYDDNPNGRLYNQAGQGGVIAGGVALTTIGALAITPALINGIRVATDTSESRELDEEGPTIRPDVPCDRRIAVNGQRVTLRDASLSIDIGAFTTSNELDVDLRALAERDPRLLASGAKVFGVWIGDSHLADIELERALVAVMKELRERDEAAWLKAESTACADQISAAACAGVQLYANQFPNGAHGAEANRLLTRFGLASSGAAVVADGPASRAQKAALDAREAFDAAAEKAREKLEAEAEKVFEKQEAEIAKLAKVACEASCKKTCEIPDPPPVPPPSADGKPGKPKPAPPRPANEVKECTKSCSAEVCQ